VHNNIAVLGNPEVKKETFKDNCPRNKLPKVRRMPDDFKSEPLLLSKYITPRPWEEILSDIIPTTNSTKEKEMPL
jgi:hypothetical protein